MPRQGITILEKSKKKTGKAFIAIRKTGFVDLWWYDRHYYTENGVLMVEPIDFDAMTSDYNARQQAKKKITVRRR